MTIELFMILVTVCSAVSVVFTQSVKQWYNNTGKNCSPNLIALINAFIVGSGGTYVYYVFNNIPFTQSNIICLILMTIIVWIGSMIGYDKVIQLIAQIKK